MLDRYIKQSPMAGNTGLGGGPTGTALGGGAGLTVTLGGNEYTADDLPQQVTSVGNHNITVSANAWVTITTQSKDGYATAKVYMEEGETYSGYIGQGKDSDSPQGDGTAPGYFTCLMYGANANPASKIPNQRAPVVIMCGGLGDHSGAHKDVGEAGYPHGGTGGRHPTSHGLPTNMSGKGGNTTGYLAGDGGEKGTGAGGVPGAQPGTDGGLFCNGKGGYACDGTGQPGGMGYYGGGGGGGCWDYGSNYGGTGWGGGGGGSCYVGGLPPTAPHTVPVTNASAGNNGTEGPFVKITAIEEA